MKFQLSKTSHCGGHDTEVEISTLEELLEFVMNNGRIVLDQREVYVGDGTPCMSEGGAHPWVKDGSWTIEIYDTWRE